MKTSELLLTIATLFIVNCLFAQNDDGKKVEFQIKKRSSFYSVDARYNIIPDTIYHADEGFRVFSGFDVEKLKDGIEYVIFRYPDWKDNQQVNQTPIPQQKTKKKLEPLQEPVHFEIVGRNGLHLAMPKDQFDKLKLEGNIEDVYSLKWKYSTMLASGFMTIPFKLRPKQGTVSFNMTTDVTLGAYLGVKKRISRKGNNFIVVPFTLGLSYINVGNNETSNVNTKGNSSIVPGWTWSTGLVFDLNGFNVGCVLGKDYASGIGNDWLYNKKLWYSFSIGYSFFSKSEK